MATTEDAVIDRVRAVLTGLKFHEVIGFDFSRLPHATSDHAFAVGYAETAPIGGIGLHEEARGTVIVQYRRPINEDYQSARRKCRQDVRAIVNAVIRDGSVSGIYAVEDAGRGSEVDAPVGASYLVARIRLPLNFEAEL